jgi:hypothetical protein
MWSERSLYQLTQSLRAHHQVLEELEGALPEEEMLSSSGRLLLCARE